MRFMNRVCSALLSASMILAPTVSAMAEEESTSAAHSTAEESVETIENVEMVVTEEEGVSEYDAAYTGLANYSGNVWRYLINGAVQWGYTGLVQYYGTWYYIEKGTLNWNYTGLTNYYGTWYYVEKGVLNWNYTGLTNYYGTWYYVEKGVLNWNYTGLTDYYGTWYYVESGILNWKYNGLTNYYGTWYYVEKGILNWKYNSITNYYGTWYCATNGVLTWDYTGLVYYYGTWYYVEKSVLNWNYTGYVEFLGHKYYVENGVMVRRENQFKLQDISAESDKFAITPMLIYYNQQVNDSYYPEYTEAVGWDGTATTWRFSLGVGLSNALWTSVDLTTGIATLWWDRLGYGRSNEGTVDFINKTATNGWDGFFKTPDKQIKTKGFLWEEFGITNQQQLIDMMKTGKGKASISAAISKQGRLGEVDYLGTTGKGRIVLALTDTSGTELGYAVVDPEYNYFIVYSMRCKFLAESRISQ